MISQSTELSLSFGDPDETGRVVATLHAGGQAIHVDRLDRSSAVDREAFKAAALKTAPGLDGDDLLRQLLPRPSGPRSSDARTEGLRATPPPIAPYPVHVLPLAIREQCEAVAVARSVDVAVPATFALAAMASAVGAARSWWDDFAEWEEPSVVWAAIVMPSGQRKSPVLNDMFAVHFARQARLAAQHEEERKRYRRECDAREPGRKRGDAACEEMPEPPVMGHVWSSDATSEGAVRILRSAPRGVIVICDELASFFGGMGRYSKGGPVADRSFWLSCHAGKACKIDRAGQDSVFVAKGLVSVVGGIQPQVLARCFDDDARASGLAARFLLVMPPPKRKEYRAGPSDTTKQAYGQIIEGLFELEMPVVEQADAGPPGSSRRVSISSDCRALLENFVPDWSSQSDGVDEALSAAASKLEGYALRFALLFWATDLLQGRVRDHEPIARQHLAAGIELVRWYRDEAARCYDVLRGEGAADPGEQIEGRVATIRSLGGGVTPREWKKRNTRRTLDEARRELDDLVRLGRAEWVTRPSSSKGGAPTMECRLLPEDAALGGDSAGTEEKMGGPAGTGGDDPRAARHETLAGYPPRAPWGDAGCGLRGASEEPCGAAPLGSSFEARVDGETEPDSVPNRGRDNQQGSAAEEREGCRWSGHPGESPRTPQPATHNPIAAEGVRMAGQGHHEVFVSDTIAKPNGGCDNWDRDVIPLSKVFESSSSPSCWNCGSTAWWCLRDAGNGQRGDLHCARCRPPVVDEHLVLRLDFEGGVA